MKTIVIVNLLTGYDREAGLIAQALTQIAIEASMDFGCLPPNVSVAADPSNPHPADATLVLAPHSDAAAAAGYHFLDDDGQPMLRAFLDGTTKGELLCDVAGAGDSLMGIAAHELLETMNDEPANLYVAAPWLSPDGMDWSLRAREVCDPVQGQVSILVLADGTKMDAPNWVTNAYFNPKAAAGARLDRLYGLKTPGELAPNGYQIAAHITSQRDVFAAMVTHPMAGPPAAALQAKKHRAARTQRRLRNILKVLQPAGSR